MTGVAERGRGRAGVPSLAALLGLGMAVWGLRIGLIPLNDNSLLTHLATGQQILDSGSVPTTDPYSFTAPGHPWVVQSWLASVIYAAAHEVAPGHGILAVNSVLTVTLALLVWRLTRPAVTLVPRLAVAAATMAIGSSTWVERPLLFGLVAMATVVLVTEDERIPPWVLAPVAWLWVNAHGSWPLGLVYLAVRLAGESGERGERPARQHWRPLVAMGGGVLFAAVNPLGPRLLVFPVELLQRSDILQSVVEWQAPTFQSAAQRLFLVELFLAALLLTRRSGRWADAAVLALFGAAAVLSARNVAVASLVLVPVLARGLAELGTLRGEARAPLNRAGASVLVALAALMGVAAAQNRPFDLSAYPSRILAFAEVHHDPQRVAAPDWVGNLRGLLADDDERVVFIDDRYDMWPEEVVDDGFTLLRARPEWAAVLDEWEIDAVIWGAGEPIVSVLVADARWRVVATDGSWALVVPRDGRSRLSG